jgi:recombination protein RecA
MNKKTITVGEVNSLLKEGKTIKVKTLNGEYTRITDFVDKGILDTYLVSLDNGLTIKVSREHKFFTNVGWVECKDIIPNKHSILCDTGKYSLILSVALIGKYKIVDITVDHPEHCYFGNGMLNHNTGKSLLCAHIIAETEKMGGLSVFFDSEFAVDRSFWTALGVNLANTNYVPFTTLEELFNNIELCIGAFRKANRDKLLTIFVDSVAGASIDSELESEHGSQGYATGKSLILGKAMRKITGLIARQRILIVFTNQLRYNMNSGPFGDKWLSPGGKALPFAASVRVRMASLGKLKRGDEVVGVKCQCAVIKTRHAPNHRTAQFEILYDSGIQDLASWLSFAKERNIITGTAAKYVWKREGGEELTFNTAKFVELMNSDEKLKEEFYQQICKTYIMEYRTPNSKIEENLTEVEGEDAELIKVADKDE